MLKDLSIEDFMNALCSKAQAPGGGAASSYAAAMACSLVCMIFNITLSSKRYNELDDDTKNKILEINKKCEKCEKEMVSAADEDAQSFLSLMSMFKLPKNSQDEIEVRNKSIEAGYIKALNVPYNLFLKAVKVYDYIDAACDYGNTSMISDAGIASNLLYAAIESSILNVKINLSGVNDSSFKEEIEKKCSSVHDISVQKNKEISDKVSKKMDISK